MAERPTCSECGHKDTYHVREAGFYDVRPRLGKCDVVGCGCARYRPNLSASRATRSGSKGPVDDS